MDLSLAVRTSRPDELKHLTRKFLMTVTEATDGFEAIRDHVIGRYNNNIRYVDDQLRRLFADVGSQATVVLFSDHGEEFGAEGFEHGHTFHDELLRVPLIVRSPELPPGRISAPVSLLDIAPTMSRSRGSNPRFGTDSRLSAWPPDAASTLCRTRSAGLCTARTVGVWSRMT